MRRFVILSVWIFILISANNLLSETIMRSYSEIQINDITGPGKGSSFYEDEVRFLSELTIFSRGKWRDILNYSFSVKGRYTDSKTINREKETLQEFKFWIGSNKFETTIGDYFVNFSQYSITKIIKGMSLIFKENEDKEGLSLEIIGGTFKEEPLNRLVGGIKLRYKKDTRNSISLNYAYVWDNKNDENQYGGDTYKQHIVSIDWNSLIKGFDISGEFAYSGYRRYIAQDRDSVETAFASKLSVNKDLTYNLEWKGEFEYIDPDFLSLGGSYIPDRIRTSNELTYWFTRKFSVFLRQGYYRDNLEGDLGRTTRVNTSSIGIKLRGLFNRRRLRVRISYKLRDSDISNNPTYKTYWLRLSGSDTFKGFRIHTGFHYVFENNKFTDDLRRYGFNLSISKRISRGIFYLKPYIRLSYDDTDIRQETVSLTYAAGVNFYIGRYIQGNFNVDRSEINILSGIDREATRYNFRIIYLLEGLLGKIAKELKSPHLTMDLKVNDYNYSQDTQNHKETLLRIGFNWGYKNGN